MQKASKTCIAGDRGLVGSALVRTLQRKGYTALATSQVLLALVRKSHEAKVSGAKEVPLWGTGSPRREFPHSDDMAEACILLMELPDKQFAKVAVPTPGFLLVNIGAG